MTISKEDAILTKTNHYSTQFENALQDGNFEEAFALALSHAVLQNKTLSRMDFKKRMEIGLELAKKVADYAKTFQGFGFNGNTFLNFAQAGSGMFGLIGLKPELLGAAFSTLTFKETFQIGQVVQQIFGSIKGLKDEGTQGIRVIDQNQIEEIKRTQEQLKTDIQQLHSAKEQLLSHLKQLNEQKHRAKMNSVSG